MHAVRSVAFSDDDRILSGALQRHGPAELCERLPRHGAERADSGS